MSKQILHILNRLSFGAAPGDLENVQQQGIKNYLNSQLANTSLAVPGQFPTLRMNNLQLYQEYGPTPKKKGQTISTEQRQKENRERAKVIRETRQAHIFQAVTSKQQLQEVMVNFWFAHFNIFISKSPLVSIFTGKYVQEAIRPHVFGKFRNLLAATVRHPAMLAYLDNRLNTAPGSKGARGAFKGLNENYARELMELHTLGVDGGYSQQDVITLAKILTGWGIDTNGKGDERGFYFDANRHDFSDKVFLGNKIKGSGEQELEKVLDILTTHPSTARHLSYKLAQYFISDKPPATLVKNLALEFISTNGDIKQLLQSLFNSQEFLQPQYYGSKFKTPFEYLVSLVRASGINNPDLSRMNNMLVQMGMPVYGCLTPDGYKNTQDAWLNPDSIIRRTSIAINIASGRLGGKPVDAVKLAQTLGNNFSPNTQSVLDSNPPQMRSGLILGSPEMMLR